MIETIRLRRDTAANWTSLNPVLSQGEVGTETDTSKAKLGDGATAWNSLPYWNPSGPGGAVVSVFGRSGAVSATSGDYTVSEVTGAAPLASPALTGNPTAPTQAGSDNSTKIATTAYVTGAVSTETTRAGTAEAVNAAAITAETGRAETAEALLAPKASPALTGSPTAPTQTTGDSSTKIATDAFVATAVAAETSRAEAAESAIPPLATLSEFPGTIGAFNQVGTGTDAARWDHSHSGVATVNGSAGAVTVTPLLTRTSVQTSGYTAAANQIVPCDTTSGSLTVTLPNAPAAGTMVAVKQVTLGTGNTVTVACAGSDVFSKTGGATSGTLKLTGQGMLMHYSGSGIWTVLSDDLPLSQLDTRYGTKFIVPPPTGATATDTPAVQAVISAMTTAGGNGTLLFQDGTYQVDGNSLVIQSCTNFAVRGTGGTIITQAPNTVAKPNNTGGNIFTIADCSDFTVEELTLDALRDSISPVTALSATASSGQPSVTVAAGQGARYQVGQRLKMLGGLGSTDQNLNDGYGTSLVISSISAGGGAGGGDLITFTVNLAHTYTQISATLISDGWGPYAGAGAYIYPYQTGNATVAGRGLAAEDQQCALHLLNCSQFTISRVNARNTWESGIRLGRFTTGIAPIDACTQGTVSDCRIRHGYDQGVGIWHSQEITVTGCNISAPGWTGVDMCGSDGCTIVGNQIDSSVYRISSSQAGFGVAIDGGTRNTVAGNAISNTFSDGVHLDISPSAFLTGAVPTMASWMAPGVSSLTLSATTSLIAGGRYSIIDGASTEAITVATITDGTHVALAQPTLFGHASGVSITERVPEGNMITGNTVVSPGGSGLLNTGPRNTYKGNTLYNCGGNSITLTTSSACVAEGNVCSGTGLSGIVASGSFDVIRGNYILFTGTSASPQFGIQLNGVSDSEITGNVITGSGKAGITGSPTRCRISENRISQCVTQGILFSTGADSLLIEGNTVTSCFAGIDLRGVTNSAVLGNACISNQHQGIILQNTSGGTGCSTCRVTGNECRDDGSGINPATGAAWTQQNGILESGASNFNLFTENECDANASAQITTAGANSYAWANLISGAASGNFPAALIPQLADYAPSGLTGATAASRYAGATASGAPASGTFAVGDYVVDQTGAFWVCTTAGTPGTWTAVGSGSAADYAPTGLTGATSASRYTGATTSGAPASGTFVTGDFIVDRSGAFWVCTAGGSPGTWQEVSGSGGGLTNPMTTLGDTIYGGSSGTASRLAGNTTAQKLYWSQTGTGSVSAAPAWSGISGQYLCTPTQYAPGSQTSLTNATTTLAAVSSANVNTGSFVAPASGSVFVTVSLVCQNSSGSAFQTWGLAAHGTVTPLVSNAVITYTPNATALKPAVQTMTFLVTGLTAGTSYNFDLLFGSSTGTLTVLAFGTTSTTAGSTGGAPVTMTVQAV